MEIGKKKRKKQLPRPVIMYDFFRSVYFIILNKHSVTNGDYFSFCSCVIFFGCDQLSRNLITTTARQFANMGSHNLSDV